MAKNRVIGINNQLPWHVPEDLKFFRDTTKGKILIMGRKTFDSLGGKPLPGRLHIVITRQSDWKFDHSLVLKVSSVDEAIAAAEQKIKNDKWPEEVFVTGGSEIYQLFMSKIDHLYLTEIDLEPEGDAHFPDFSKQGFRITSESTSNGNVGCRFLKYSR